MHFGGLVRIVRKANAKLHPFRALRACSSMASGVLIKMWSSPVGG